MKTLKSLFLLSLFALWSVSSFAQASKSKIKVQAPKTSMSYKVDLSKSNVKWVGNKTIGAGHNGSINVQSASLDVVNEILTSVNVVIDMTSIKSTDLANDKEWGPKLIGHLSSDDFFGVAKYPTATFTSTSVSKKAEGVLTVLGNLSIKDITLPIQFDVKTVLSADKKSIELTSDVIKVDRTKYGIRYGSNSFFDKLGDKAIENEFTLEVKLIAVK